MADSGPIPSERRGQAQAEAVLGEAAQAFRVALGERLLATYALGSLAHGGFSSLVSDVDLGLVLADPPRAEDGETVKQISTRLKTQGSELHERLSVFWGTPSTLRGERPGGRFPPLDRLDLIQHGRLLDGEDARADLPQPSVGDLLVAGAEFALGALAGDDVIEQIHRPEVLFARGVRPLTKIVLFPVRFLYSAETGHVGTNHAAADHYLASRQGRAPRLVAAALSWRVAPPARAAAMPLLERELIPLYLQYIDDYSARLSAAGRSDLAASFDRWGGRVAVGGQPL